ncbi:MAG: 23S rRNA (adenine(2503)-C(2))-methyltransferase RlmN, partial [Cytophagales bacterium]|nr:23S rRNA (adenine(2503)-C(2))-methyltransferase RlmN [Cytophagales bacterium]
RQRLGELFTILPAQRGNFQLSNDGTLKTTFVLHDGNIVEGVLIPKGDRVTACISSQVGCSLTCKFCATGYMDRKRNLEAAEIYDQVVHLRKMSLEQYGLPLTNIVYMGMGEPLLNYQNVLKSTEYILSEKGLNMANRRVTVSTAGISKMIKKLGDDGVKFNLALSLHAANDEKRNRIMPINESNSLQSLTESLNYFYDKTGTPPSFEYIVFNNFNDSLDDAKELYDFWKSVQCRIINIIEYNPIAEADFKNASQDKLTQFANYLTNRGVNVQIRRSRGKDIDAACGQLANKQKNQ